MSKHGNLLQPVGVRGQLTMSSHLWQ